MREFAINLKKARKSKELTQEEFAKELVIPLRTYQNWESLGKSHNMPNIEMIKKIAHALEISIDELVGF